MSNRDAVLIGLLVAVAGVVFAAVGLPVTKVLIGVAIIAFLVGGWRTLEHAPVSDPIRIVAFVVCLGSVVALLLINAAGGGGGKTLSAPDPRHEASPGKVLHVYNRVTSGPRKMREDKTPVYLSTKPVIFCSDRNCRIPETNRQSGDTYDAAVCQREGERTTNGEDASRIDDHNPGLFSSRRYYGVRLDQDTFGYVSEVWIAPKQRGGLGLPSC
ncbi:MAG: hypothetical protein ACTHLH_03900 [Solirubrobacterales bacterium]